MPRIPHRRFTDEFKSQAVTLAESIGPAQAARQLDISVKSLANWITAAPFPSWYFYGDEGNRVRRAGALTALVDEASLCESIRSPRIDGSAQLREKRDSRRSG